MTSSLKKPHVFILLLCLLLATFIAYLPALKGQFNVWDDNVHLKENITLRSLDSEHLHDMFASRINSIYIPLTTLSFALEYHFAGYKPFIYYLNNILLHLTIIIMVFAFLKRLGMSNEVSLISVALFALHPTRVESVAWITERKDVLYASLYVLALLSYVRYLSSIKPRDVAKKFVENTPNYFYLTLATVLGVLSILAKPMAVSLPLIFMLLDWYWQRKITAKAFIEKIPVFSLLVGICWLGTYSQHIRVPVEAGVNPFLAWIWTFSFYIRQFFLPLVSVPVYRLPQPVSLMNIEYVISLLTLAGTLFGASYFRKNRIFIFCLLFYVLSMFFLWRTDTSDINVVADRFMYLPSIGFCLGAALLIEQLFRWKRSKVIRGVVMTALVAILTIFWVKTNQLSNIWLEAVSLWKHELKYFPNEELAYNSLANAFRDQREYQRAGEQYKRMLKVASEGYSLDKQKLTEARGKIQYIISLYQKAIDLNPKYTDAWYNLGQLYNEVGLLNEALRCFKQTIELDPEFKDAYLSLANILRDTENAEKAISAYKENIRLLKDNPDIYVNVVLEYKKAIKDFPQQASLYKAAQEEAINNFITLINEQNPPRANLFFNLGCLYQEMGDSERAISAYSKTLEINPSHENALNNLGNTYRDLGKMEEALKTYEKALKVNPFRADPNISVGSIYSKMGQIEKAKEYFSKAVLMGETRANSLGYYNLGVISEAEGKLEEAKEYYQKASIADPNNAESHYNLGNIYASLNELKSAISEYQKAVQADPAHMNAWVNMSILSFKLGEYTNAAKYCDEAMVLGYEAPPEYLESLKTYKASKN
jgi:tetratricopeptide (TPR) repeat protein